MVVGGGEGVTFAFLSNAASLDSTFPPDVVVAPIAEAPNDGVSVVTVLLELIGLMPVTSLRPPIPPIADVKEVLFTIGLVGSLPQCFGCAGGIGRIEDVRFGGLPGGGSADFCNALSSHDDFVGDQRFREKESVRVREPVLIEGVRRGVGCSCLVAGGVLGKVTGGGDGSGFSTGGEGSDSAGGEEKEEG